MLEKHCNNYKQQFSLIFLLRLPQTEVGIERHVLSQTKTLSDGSSEKIFTRNQRNDVGFSTYSCHLCDVATLTAKILQMHIAGKKHQRMLMDAYVPDATQYRTLLMPQINRKTLI